VPSGQLGRVLLIADLISRALLARNAARHVPECLLVSFGGDRQLVRLILAVFSAVIFLGASFEPHRLDESRPPNSVYPGMIGFTADGPVVERGFRIYAPYRSQFDRSIYERSNCGVAAIAMALEYYELPVPTLTLRESINGLTGDWWPDSGIDWRHLMLAVEGQGLSVAGPYADRDSYRVWTVDELLAETSHGRPVIILLRYRALPGHEDAEYGGDHYIILLGATADGRLVYHDPGFPGLGGAYRTADRATFERAWSHTWIGQNRTAMVVYR
jgi:hypothetical protein